MNIFIHQNKYLKLSRCFFSEKYHPTVLMMIMCVHTITKLIYLQHSPRRIFSYSYMTSLFISRKGKKKLNSNLLKKYDNQKNSFLYQILQRKRILFFFFLFLIQGNFNFVFFKKCQLMNFFYSILFTFEIFLL